jgi:hypothetical protein
MFIKFNSKKEGESFLPNYQVSPLFLFVKEYYFETGKSNKLIHFHFYFPQIKAESKSSKFLFEEGNCVVIGLCRQ